MPLNGTLKVANFMLYAFHLVYKKRNVTCSKLSYMDQSEHSLQPSQSLHICFCKFVSNSEISPCPLGEMCFPFREFTFKDVAITFSQEEWRSGNAWTLVRGPWTGTWCWRPTGTWSPWVRITSLQESVTTFVYLCISPWESFKSP